MRDLKLDNRELTNLRYNWTQALTVAQEKAPDLYEGYMGHPTNLVDFERLRPPANSKPGEIAQSLYGRLHAASQEPTFS